ncbi:STAS domain-containing protein [Cellulomonas oligotrophica]|uniref:Anti-sigma factor antagonist n=1 Tax=Cellulomonas oligotrophica TaxID=931536 RepID=A0A7Y9JXW5_9CELL|nr:STAS domain-containing protein [Cellulomonas oligotrophica]NYD86301.1 anti-anti-sigma factor [Cellulomonas oligotrophica]GIG32808.1 anti-sigma factor antagonist [Cellulomonas oligotrophica]
MEIGTQVQPGGVAVLRPQGRLTMVTAGELKAEVERTVAEGHPVVVLDLADVPFVDSSGLGALVGALRTARTAGGDLRIARVGAQVATVLSLTTMDRVLRPYASVEDAVGAS